ncbi:helix-turn-helix domain-containing protein [Frigoribacterium sp. CFBP 8751]|uniref:helix-turn-helix domain-containing protein n=1 Tax=Frigoribacterium sp. CFBP 8751 TaxID=2775277 RepID=UPI0017866643|nr:AraC family transcriptional regulator [Frigoribacterium sp. CFBP 8751]
MTSTPQAASPVAGSAALRTTPTHTAPAHTAPTHTAPTRATTDSTVAPPRALPVEAFVDPRVRSVSTSDREVAHALIRKNYKITRLEGEGPEPFTYSRAVSGETRFALCRFEYRRGRLLTESEPAGFLVAGGVMAGRLSLRTRDHEIRVDPGAPFAFPSHEAKVMESFDLVLGQVLLDRAAVERELGAMRLAAPGGLRSTATEAVSAAMARYWSELVVHVHENVIRNDAAMASSLVRGSAFRSLVAAYLETFETNVVGVGGDDGVTPLPSTVRRARDYIEQHAHDDIGVVEIAEAARVTPRALQLAFRRHLDSTPMAELRRARLRGAHGDLVMADPTLGHTVAGVALNWGFAHAGRFAAQYTAEFGRSPRDTLEG